MQVSYKTNNINLTPDVRSYAEDKLEAVQKLLTNHAEENVSCDVVLGKSEKQTHGDIYRADVTVHAGSERVHAVGHGESLMAALDEAKDDITRRMRREKTKQETMLRRGGAALKKMLRWG
jgi:ribosomal subunit interface protein